MGEFLPPPSLYIGGKNPNPSYEDICNGDTGHAEAIEIEYDADEVSFDELMLIFFRTHNPTTLNRQGNDVGTQYRSAIFYASDEQKQQAEAMIERLTNEHVFDQPIVTKLEPATEFYIAEDYHQNYYNNNGAQPYCYFVVRPKVEKFQKVFKNKLRAQVQ